MQRRPFLVLVIVLVALLGVNGLPSHVAQGAHLDKKVCKTKKVHGKKKKVCHQVTVKPTATVTLSLAQKLDRFLTSGGGSGSALIVKDGQELFKKSYGMADREQNVPNTPQTKTPIFVGASFSAVAIMKLQEGGKLSLGESVCKYIPTCPAAWTAITIAEVIERSSGLADYDIFHAPAGTAETLAACKSLPLVATPGASHTESRCEANMAAAIIEGASGKPWATFLQEAIFLPAGMTNTGRMSNALKPPQRARGYVKSGPGEEANYDAFYPLYSTLDDMQRFVVALLGGKIISPASMSTLFTPRFKDRTTLTGGTSWHASGFDVFNASSTRHRIVDLEGGFDTGGFGMGAFFSPDTGSMAILLVNRDTSLNQKQQDTFIERTLFPGLFGK